jgi:hypothetical protein
MQKCRSRWRVGGTYGRRDERFPVTSSSHARDITGGRFETFCAMLLCKYTNLKNVNYFRDVSRRCIGFQRAVGNNDDKKPTLRQVITQVKLEQGKIETRTPKKRWRKKGKLLGKSGAFVDTHFVAQTGAVCSIAFSIILCVFALIM